MEKPGFCVIDVGTGRAKCLVFDQSGNLVSSSSTTINFLIDGKAISFDPNTVWDDICRMIRNAVKECSKTKTKIVAISSTSMREGNVFYDSKWVELLAVPNLDERAHKEAVVIGESHGDQIYLSSGHWPTSLFLVSRLKFLKDTRPVTYEKIAKISMINDWVLYRLSGKIATEPTNGCETGLFSLKKRDWSDELIKECRFERKLFPEIKVCGSVLGQLTKQSSRRTGLDESTIVIVGAADTESAVAGCGLSEPGSAVAIAGSTTPIQAVVDQPVIDEQRRTWTCCHLIPDRWVVESNAGATGLVLEWWKKMTGIDYIDLDKEVESRRHTPGRLKIDIGTRVMNSKIPHPIEGAIQNISPWTTRSEVTLGILETNCFSVRGNLEQLESVLNVKFEELFFCGGASKSKLWRRLQADILGRTIVWPTAEETTARGVAMLCAVATGSFSNLKEAAGTFVKRKISIKPNGQIFESYEPYYQEWLAGSNGWIRTSSVR